MGGAGHLPFGGGYAQQPAALMALSPDYCFYNDLPAGAWLDAPDILAAGSHCNYRGFPTPSIAGRL